MNRLAQWLDQKSLYLALLAAWVALLGSLYFSEVDGFIPCILCWYQRICMYPLAVILPVGLGQRDHHLPVLVLPLSLTGLGIASYHYLLEKTDLFAGVTTCQASAPCTVAWINWFGFVTIPFLSLIGFLTITLMAVIALNAGEPLPAEPSDRSPWWPVVGIIALVVVAFGVLYFVNHPTTKSDSFTVLKNEQPLAQSKATGETDATDGQVLYAQACAACHGQKLEGVPGLGTALVGSALLREQSDAQVLQFIRNGRARNDPSNASGLVMPPSGGHPELTDEQLSAMIRYMRKP
jgi:disulfide bond formation protein DsbB/mono/diheme cytochrome c family protein